MSYRDYLHPQVGPPPAFRTSHTSLKIHSWAVAFSLLLTPVAARGQVEIVSAPPEISLLDMFVRKWSADSPLGDLRARALGDDDIEVRAWGGFGLTGTGATVLRRAAGQWHAWRVIVHTCSVWIPIVGSDTLTDQEIARYHVQARAECGAPEPKLAAAHVISVDTLAIEPVLIESARIDSAWHKALDAGLLSLPSSSPLTMLDGYTYVIEVRMGGVYRATELPHIKPTETETDAQVQRVFAALTRLAP